MKDWSNTVSGELRGNAKVSVLDGIVDGFAYTSEEFSRSTGCYCGAQTLVRHLHEFSALLVLLRVSSVKGTTKASEEGWRRTTLPTRKV
jgi:hypothetical protein